MPRLPVAGTLCLTLSLLTGGCSSSDGPARFPVSGSVTFNGEPVPAGAVVFTPDHEQGNQGPAAYAPIHQGRYETEKGKGVIGGPHKVRITGQSGESTGALSDTQKLFEDYETERELPKKSSVQDFKIDTGA
jgi:hypothetical protein